MAIRKSYSAPVKSNEPTTFAGKYSLKNRAGLDEVDKDAYVIALDMNNGYAEIPYHTLKKSAGGNGFKNSQYNSKIVCHKFDKNTGEVVDQLPLCCRIAQLEKDRLSDKSKSIDRAMSFMSKRVIIPVLVLSVAETESGKKPSLKKVSIKNGIDFSFIDFSQSAFEEFRKGVKDNMETEGLIDSASEDSEEVNMAMTDYLKTAVIKITNITAKNPSIPYEKAYKAIPLTNQMVAKESGEQKLIDCVVKVLNGAYPAEKQATLFEKHPEIAAINNQVIDFIDLFNSEVDNLVSDWTDEELQGYYDEYLEKQGVINTYKSSETPNVAFKQKEATVVEDFDFEVETAKELAKQSVATIEKSEDEFDFSTSDLEESSILDDEDFQEDDFAMIDGDDL